MRRASSAASPGVNASAFTPGSISSDAPPARLTTTGFRQAIASAITSPNGSGSVLACTTMSSARIAVEASGTNPVNPTRSSRPRARTSSRSSETDVWLPEVS